MKRRPAPAVIQAKQGHPSAGWRPDRERFRQAVGEKLRAEGCAWPDYVAALLQVRAALGVDQAGFAHLLGIDPSVVARLEAGQIAPADAPAAVARLMPMGAWAQGPQAASGSGAG